MCDNSRPYDHPAWITNTCLECFAMHLALGWAFTHLLSLNGIFILLRQTLSPAERKRSKTVGAQLGSSALAGALFVVWGLPSVASG